MNAAFPDYDFSNSPEVFARCDRHEAAAKISPVLTSSYSVSGVLVPDDFWTALEREICPAECDVYTYRGDIDIFGDAIWAMIFFYHNPAKKRMLYVRFSCHRTLPRSSTRSPAPDNDDDIF